MDAKSFRTPGALDRNAPFWSWNDNLDKDELLRQIDDMAAKGWGSYFMHSRVGLITKYLSDDWMDLIRACAEKARETGTKAWLYDEDKWPSGYASGEVPLADENFRHRCLAALEQREIGPNDTVMAEYDYNDKHYFICRRVSPLGDSWFNGTCYIDLLNPDAVRKFIECTHERYKAAVGEYFGKEIPGMFTDEPGYHYDHHFGGVPSVVWSEALPPFFEKMKGYSILDKLTSLFFPEGDFRKVRYDFYEAATALFIDSFTRPYYEWCDRNHLKMVGHFISEENALGQTMATGSLMSHYEFMHWPGVDKLSRHIEHHVTMKQATSVADQLGKEKALCEIFGCIGQQSSFFHRKWLTDWAAALGITFMNSHLSLYSMKGERKRDFPANLFYQQPWWDDERKFADYTGRLCNCLSQGRRETEILMLHTVRSVWCELSPMNRLGGVNVEMDVYCNPFDSLSLQMIQKNLDFHYGDDFVMLNHGRVENGKLIVGNAVYTTVTVPPALTLSSNTVRLLRDLVAQAGPESVVFTGRRPVLVDGAEADYAWADACPFFVRLTDCVSWLDKKYAGRIKTIDKLTGANADKIFIQTRRDEDGRFVFLCNTDDKREIDATIALPDDFGRLVMLDLTTGLKYKMMPERRDGFVWFDVKLYPAGSLMLYQNDTDVFYDGIPPRFCDSGAEFPNTARTVGVLNDWKVTLLEQNVMPLNDATLYMDGKLIQENRPVAEAWHSVFFASPDGTPYKAEYSFEVKTPPKGEFFAAIENAENLDRITVNGIEVKPAKARGETGAFDPAKSWKDLNFTKVDMSLLLKPGTNTITIEGRKVNNITGPCRHIGVADHHGYDTTELEAIYLVGDFYIINEDNVRFTIDGARHIPCAADITSSGYPFYTGKVSFSTKYFYENKIGAHSMFLKVGEVKAACIEVLVNGKRVDARFVKPYVFDIGEFLTDGANEIEVVAAGTLFNLMGPNRYAGIKELRYTRPMSFCTPGMFTETYEFYPLGIGSGSIMMME